MMVAIVVLSIGLLGLAGLQAATSKYKVNTLAFASVATLVSDVSEKIRVNPDAAGTSFVQGVESASQYVLDSDWTAQQAATLTIAKNCETTSCTPNERAAFDLKSWQIKVRNNLPQGAALVSGTKRDGINVTMMWFDKELTKLSDTSDPASARVVTKAPVCTGSEIGMAQQSCCPEAASAPAGVRCARFSFLP